MHSSQNEQDSRFYGQFALVPTFEPSNQQEAYDMVQAAFDFSEKYRIPVLMRLTTRMAHSRAVVEVAGVRAENERSYPAQTRQWVLMPGNSRVRYNTLLDDYARFETEAAESRFNRYTDAPDKSVGIIACGIAHNYLAENYPGGLSASRAENFGSIRFRPHSCAAWRRSAVRCSSSKRDNPSSSRPCAVSCPHRSIFAAA